MKLAVIRIRGQIGLKQDIKETLDRLRIRKKYACVVLNNPDKTQMGMVKKIKENIAFGEIDDATYKKLVDARGKKDTEGKLKPFFGLHPPRGGIEAKKGFGVGKGVLGNHGKDINKLIERML